MKNVLIIGAGSAIGQQIIAKQLKHGKKVYATSRNPLENLDSTVEFLQMNPTNADEVAQLADFIPEELNGLVYCPGTINLKPFRGIKPDQFREEMEINFMGAVHVVQAVEKSLKKSKDASVLFFSTVAVQQGMPFHASIAAAKGALEGLTRSLAAEYSGSNVRFNAIAPSLTDTPLAEKLLSNEQKVEASEKRHPIHRVGTPQDMGGVASFLMEEEASWITGQIIGVDGGLSSLKPL